MVVVAIMGYSLDDTKVLARKDRGIVFTKDLNASQIKTKFISGEFDAITTW